MHFRAAMGAGLVLLLVSQLSYPEVLAAVRENSDALKAARAETAIADAEVERAWTGWQPRLDVVGSVTFNSQEQVFDPRAFLPPGTTADVGEPAVLQKHVQLAGVARLSQTLFDLGVLRAPGAAKAARAAAIARAEVAEDELLFQAAALYATLAGVKAQEAAADRALAVAEQRVADARVQVEAGTATPLVLTRASTDRVTALGAKAALLAERRAAAANLGAMIAAEGEVEIAGERLSEVISPAQENERAIVVAREKEVIAAEKAIGLSDAKWLPTILAEGTGRYTNAPGFADEDLSASATINVVLPIYDGGLRYAETHAAEARAAVAKHRLDHERRAARAYVAESRARWESAKAELEQAEAQLNLANETVSQTEQLTGAGLATNLELTDADARRFTADRAVAQKRLALDLAVLRVHYATGGKLTSQ